jgi:DNA invertase Pin-like site-specific DNA recombinase
MEPGKLVSIRRCAIYTRKSSEEGLEQDFNSLHAQREACEAFIQSQAGEGWRLIKTAYDDGGLSGGNMERPALKRLLADIGSGLVDVAVVYKVDRLTRSLADFAKMVEVFDTHGVSFVAVTQQFNTTTSMGRLTLNVLLSFAQIEREVTGERIRDKIAASKRKGLWMGGVPSLGYDVRDRSLVVNETEAPIVKLIYGLYLKLGSVRLLEGLGAANVIDSTGATHLGPEEVCSCQRSSTRYLCAGRRAERQARRSLARNRQRGSIDACPAERTKRSRLGQMGSSGSKRRKCCHKQ